MDILGLSVRVSLAGAEISMIRSFGRILSWGVVIDVLQGMIPGWNFFCLDRDSCYLWVVSSEVVKDRLMLISLLP